VFLDAPFERLPDGPAVVLVATPRSVDSEDPGGAVRLEFTAGPPQKIASGLLGVVTVEGWGAAALFDKRTGQLAAVIPVGEGPAGLALDAARLRAYVAVSGGDAVAVLDLLEQRVRDRVRLRAGDAPRDVAVTPDGRVLLVANSGSDTVSFVDAHSSVELERIAVAGRPVSILMDPTGRRALVVAERARSVVALNVVTRTLVGSMQTESGPFLARFGGRSGETVLVAHADSPYVTVADAATLAEVGRVYVGIGARSLEVDRRSGKIFVARSRTRRIEVFDGVSLLPVEEIPVPGEVAWLAVEREGNALGVLLTEPPEARILSLFGSGALARVPLGASPWALRFLEAR
jgi:YVTN family beta-propeller protein